MCNYINLNISYNFIPLHVIAVNDRLVMKINNNT